MCISEFDQGFIAGFLEGEAHFFITEHNGGWLASGLGRGPGGYRLV
jgi:hypothetical protein